MADSSHSVGNSPGLLRKFSRKVTNWRTKQNIKAGTHAFIEHNQRKWPQRKVSTGPVIMMGLFPSPVSILYSSYLTNFLADKFEGRIECFHFAGTPNPILKKVYESFGARLTLTMDDPALYAKDA
ncbi:MAG: hypothetical protein ABI443_05185, partial [Chthoniobacterales bacterium]